VEAWLAALEETPVSLAIKESVWVYPVAEFLHIVGFVLLVGSAVGFDLRLLGLSRSISVRALAGHLLPWAQVGLAIVVPTGVTMFLNEPTTMAANPAFRVKLVLVACGIANALVFRWPFRSVERWDRDVTAPLGARLNAVLSLILWLSTLAAGRLIAYTSGLAGPVPR
jgi:hypothetical protein